MIRKMNEEESWVVMRSKKGRTGVRGEAEVWGGERERKVLENKSEGEG